MQMWVYIVRRALLLIPIIIGVMTITFILITALPTGIRCVSYFPIPRSGDIGPTGPCPGNPSQSNCPNPWWTHCVSVLGLNTPVPVQWATYMEHSLTFNWGTVNLNSYLSQHSQYSFMAGEPVTTALAQVLPYTLELATISLLLILVVSIPLGNLSAANRNRPIDQASRVMSFSGYALAPFLLGSLLLMAFVILIGASNGWHSLTCPASPTYLEFYKSWPAQQCFPGGNYPSWISNGVATTPTGFPTVDAAYHGQWVIAADTLIRLILPAFVIAYGSIAGLLRYVRNSMLEVMNLDFVRTARAKGVPESIVINRHAGRNSLNVTITVLGLTFATFISGFPVTEDVFGLTGVGRLLALSIDIPFDYGVIFGSVLLFTYLVVAANIIVDVLYAYLDPRVRLG